MNQTVASPRLVGQILRIKDVTEGDRRQMFDLMTRYYENVAPETFESDFQSKTWVILARCPTTGDVLGFSTQWFGDYVIDNTPVGILYSGDTIVDSKYWANNPLATLWGRLALQIIDQRSGQPLYWFLISKGYKTYRFLPVFFETFYPRPNQATPRNCQGIINHLATENFGDRYEDSLGIIKAAQDGCRLRNEVAEVSEQRLRDPYVKFFDAANPGHTRGDELCCLAPLSRDNFNAAAYRVIGMPVDAPDDLSFFDG